MKLTGQATFTLHPTETVNLNDPDEQPLWLCSNDTLVLTLDIEPGELTLKQTSADRLAEVIAHLHAGRLTQTPPAPAPKPRRRWWQR